MRESREGAAAKKQNGEREGVTGVHDGRIGCERGAWAGRAPITDLVQLWKAQLDGVDQGWHKPAGWHLGKRLQNYQ